MNILVSEDIRTVCPEFVGAALEAHITNTPYSAPLWEEIKAFQTDYCRKYTTESIKEMPPIQATRSVYKRCGKDPSRYRPSSEALVRRMLRGLDLYQIDTAVDLINLASIAYRRIRCWENSRRHACFGHRARRGSLRRHRERPVEHRRTAGLPRQPGRNRHPHERP